MAEKKLIFKNGRVYAITPPSFTLNDSWLSALAKLLAGGVGCLQLRLKTADGKPERRKIIEYAPRLKKVCAEFKTPLIINDLPLQSLAAVADGFHLGADDPPMASIPAKLRRDKLIGISCGGSLAAARRAAAEGADYVAFGAFFPTATKADAELCPRDILTRWQSPVAPVAPVATVAIGGITAANCGNLAADYVAVSSYLWEHPLGPLAALTELKAGLSSSFAGGRG